MREVKKATSDIHIDLFTMLSNRLDTRCFHGEKVVLRTLPQKTKKCRLIFRGIHFPQRLVLATSIRINWLHSAKIIQDLQNEISEIRDQLATRAKRNAKDRKRLSEQEDRISELEDSTSDPGSDTSQTSENQSSDSSSEGEDTESTAPEQVVSLPDDVAIENLTSNQKRA